MTTATATKVASMTTTLVGAHTLSPMTARADSALSITACPHCGLELSQYHDHHDPAAKAQQQIVELETQVRLLNSKAVATGMFFYRFNRPIFCLQKNLGFSELTPISCYCYSGQDRRLRGRDTRSPLTNTIANKSDKPFVPAEYSDISSSGSLPSHTFKRNPRTLRCLPRTTTTNPPLHLRSPSPLRPSPQQRQRPRNSNLQRPKPKLNPRQ